MTEAPAPRIPPLPREEWTDEARRVFGYWEGPRASEAGSNSTAMMTLANHPRLALASLDMGKYILTQSTLTERQRELIVLRVAWRYRSEYQWTHHVHSSRKLGMTDAELAALEQRDPAGVWNAAEEALLRAIDQLCDDGRIDDPTWAVLTASMNRHQVMDFLYSVGFFTMNAWAFGAMGVRLESEFEKTAAAAQG